MGINPHLTLVIAIMDLQVDDRHHVIDSRWTRERDYFWSALAHLQDKLIPIPTPPKEYDLSKDGDFYAAHRWATINARCKMKKFYQLVIYDAEYGCPEVVAVVLAALPYNHDVLWALADLNRDNRGYEPRFIELPQVNPEEDISDMASIWRLRRDNPERYERWSTKNPSFDRQADRYQMMIDNGHNYGQFRMSFDGYVDVAMYLLHDLVHMTIEPKDLRLGLYWRWS